MRRILFLPLLLVFGCGSDDPATLEDAVAEGMARAGGAEVEFLGDACDLISPAVVADVLEVSEADLEGPERASEEMEKIGLDMELPFDTCKYNTDMVSVSVSQVRDYPSVEAAEASFESEFFPMSAAEAAAAREAIGGALEEMRESGDYDDETLDMADGLSDGLVTGEDDADRAPWPKPVSGLGDRAVQIGHAAWPSGVAVRSGTRVFTVDATVPSPTDIDGNLARSRKIAESILAQI